MTDEKVKQGDKVSVEYEGKFDNGEVFDSSSHGDHSHPIEFTVGEHQVIKGFEDAAVGMGVGEEKEFSIKPEDAYGNPKEELVREFPKSELPLQQEPQVGMVLGFNSPDGHQFPATITKVSDDKITLDLNHPLAGKKLNFKIKVVKIN